MANNRVLMIGIDAGDLDFIRSSPEALPRLRQLFAEGVPYELRSTADTLTSSVWPTFSTGTLPGQHGAYYPMQWDPSAMELRRVAADWLYYEPFWYELARQGKRITVLDVPFSLPSKLGQGLEVLNWGSQECLGPFSSNRAELAREIRRRFGKHPMGNEIPVQESRARLEQISNNLVAGARRKSELSRWLMQTTDWDLFVTVFAECHRGGHILWPEPEDRESAVPANALTEVYHAVDEAVGHVLDGADLETTTVVVFSVHGMRANFTQEHFVLPLMEQVNNTFAGELTQAQPAGKKNSMRMLREALPPQFQYAVARAVPAGVRDWVVKRAYCGGLESRRTPGFAIPGSGEGYLRYNLVDRESAGALEVGSDEFDRYQQTLKETLMAFKDAATDTPIVRDIVSPATLYPGPRRHLLPDLVILWNELLPVPEIYSASSGHLTGKLTTGRTGEHQPKGFAIVTGNKRRLEGAPRLEHIVDFATFTRHLLVSSAGD